MKKIISIIVVIVIIAIGAYLYVTRPVSAPSQDINDVSAKLPAGSEVQNAYRISQDESMVTFTMNELLNGKPKLVVGTTTQVAGDIAVKDGKIEFGTMTLNAKTLMTDNDRRNSAIVRLILKSDKPENEFITFKPTSNDFMGVIVPGQTVTMNIVGDLTISGVTKPTNVRVTATVTDEQIVGKAETTIKRSDFGLVIPTLSFIADVDDQFPIAVDVVAKRIMQ